MQVPMGIDPVNPQQVEYTPSFVRKVALWVLRIILFVLRITILILILIPGAIPAIILTGIYFVLQSLDPEDIIITVLEGAYDNSIGGLTTQMQILLFVGLVLTMIVVYLYQKSKNYVDKRLLRVAYYEFRAILIRFFRI